MLEDDRRVRAAVRAFLRLDGVEVGQRGHRRLLAPHPGTGPQRRDGLLAVQDGRRADDDQIGPPFPEHAAEVAVRVRDPALCAEPPERVRVDVGRGDDLEFALGAEPGERGQMGTPGDTTGAHDGGPDAPAGERDVGRPGRGSGPGTSSGFRAVGMDVISAPSDMTSDVGQRVSSSEDCGRQALSPRCHESTRPKGRSTPRTAPAPGRTEGSGARGSARAPQALVKPRCGRRRRGALRCGSAHSIDGFGTAAGVRCARRRIHDQRLDPFTSCLGLNPSSSGSSRG